MFIKAQHPDDIEDNICRYNLFRLKNTYSDFRTYIEIKNKCKQSSKCFCDDLDEICRRVQESIIWICFP